MSCEKESTAGYNVHSTPRCIGLDRSVTTALEIARLDSVVNRVGGPNSPCGASERSGMCLAVGSAGIAYRAPVEADAIEIYVAAFRARCDFLRRPDRPEIDEPGVHGFLPGGDDPLARLLVTDDRAYDVLAALLPDARAGMIGVVTAATRCLRLVNDDPAWTGNTVTAMVFRDLEKIPAPPLPKGLTLRPVRRLAGDEPDGVPLEDAVAAAMSADPRIEDEPQAFADYLRSLPPTFRLFAAVDSNKAVRATSGAGISGAYANVIFVNTHRDWRRRGIGRAMTGAALRAARDAGAAQACLDATPEGRAIYSRLGFQVAAELTRFFRSPSPPGATT